MEVGMTLVGDDPKAGSGRPDDSRGFGVQPAGHLRLALPNQQETLEMTGPSRHARALERITDLERNGEVFRVYYDLQFLGSSRLRIQPVESLERGLPSDAVSPIVILKRAVNEDVNGIVQAG